MPDLSTFGDAWLLLDECPTCGAPAVPTTRVATLADLGDYLDPDTDTPDEHLPAEFDADPAHQPGCTFGPLT